jgi:Papain-like cysteine protease AvrRpt2
MYVQLQYKNGILTINLGGQSLASNDSGGNPGNGPQGGDPNPGNGPQGGNPGNGPQGGNPGNGPQGGIILGPIVVPLMGQDGGTGTGGNPGNGPQGGNPGNGPQGGNPGNGPQGGSTGPCGCAGAGFFPTVIGPIVFTGSATAAAQTPEPPPAFVDINAILAQAPAIFATRTAGATFEVPAQLEAQWCWSAVTVGVKTFVDGTDVTQTAIASRALGGICSASPNAGDPCNKPYALDLALAAVNNLQPNGAQFNSIVAFADLQTYWNKLELPVCARIVWDDGSGTAHFIALSGYTETTAGQQLVLVHDPAPGAYGGPATWDYDLLRSSYQCPAPPHRYELMPRGHWQDSYFVKPQL